MRLQTGLLLATPVVLALVYWRVGLLAGVAATLAIVAIAWYLVTTRGA